MCRSSDRHPKLVLNAKRRAVAPDSSQDSEAPEESDDEDKAIALEPWPEFLKRTAEWADAQLEQAKLTPWRELWRRKWRWAAKVLDPKNNKWSAVATTWQPLIHSNVSCGRRQARPKKRWEDDFVQYLNAASPQEPRHWHELARDKGWWTDHEDGL